MRWLLLLVLPLVVQVLLYVAVFAATRGGGSFMRLLAMPVAAMTLVA